MKIKKKSIENQVILLYKKLYLSRLSIINEITLAIGYFVDKHEITESQIGWKGERTRICWHENY